MTPPTSVGGRDVSGSPRRVNVGVGDLAVVDDDALLTTSGLGSCVAIAVVDHDAGVRGLLHAMLPSIDDADTSGLRSPRPGKYVDSGFDVMADAVADSGGSPDRLEASLIGGAEMLDLTAPVGPRNVSHARRVLADAGVPIVASDVGDGVGRTVLFRSDGAVVVRAADGFERTL
ncbi:chemotaxis protein CheD [Halorubrum tibetense]|uniref:Probable chemoreceptor glutamine deamidase CheD n=1 Tax=Halorubrum tibetense TaxID=175631 RepID=A0ABD5SC18_9EURY